LGIARGVVVIAVKRECLIAFKREGEWHSEGRRLLALVRGSDKLLVLSLRLHISEQFLGRILNGLQRPSPEMALRLWLEFAIPVHAWVLAPGVQLVETTTGRELRQLSEPNLVGSLERLHVPQPE
jgi:hypothetical protein